MKSLGGKQRKLKRKMRQEFPTIGEYNKTISNRGGAAFQTLGNLQFIPSKTSPIKIYLFGSGTYAAVFKAQHNARNYAVRCFLSSEQENIKRNQIICHYLNSIGAKWKADCKFLDNEISVNGTLYPVLIMEWVDGSLINQFVTANLSNNDVLSELQRQLVEISNDLERHQIGHGDLQCGNIIVQQFGAEFQIKLIDYDGMYVPEFEQAKNCEKGRSEFQHPKRTAYDFSHTLDRFSFWVMLTALEALKHDKTLWKETMQGGFNTLDNFLFTIYDFINPYQSTLFNRLKQLNSTSLSFYVEKLQYYCSNELNLVDSPTLPPHRQEQTKKVEEIPIIIKEEFPIFVKEKSPVIIKEEVPLSDDNHIVIQSNPTGANVLTTTFKRLGTTPLRLNKSLYYRKTLIVSDGKTSKQIFVGNDVTEVIL